MFPSSWTQSTVGELCEMVKGASQIVRTKPGQYPLVTTGEERKTADHFQFDTAAVCVPMISAFGHGKAGLKRVQYQEGKFALANILTALIVRDQSKLLPRFLHLFLNFYKDELIVPLQSGAANMGITITKLATVPVAFPSLAEQQRIIHLITQADEINKLRARADTRTDDFIPALFNEMFGDPATNPKGWPLYPIGEFGKVTTGNTPRSDRIDYYGGEVPWVRPAQLGGIQPILSSDKTLSVLGVQVGRILRKGATLVCCIGGSLGKTGVAGTSLAINQQINAIEFDGRVENEFGFIWCALSSKTFIDKSSQATLPILNKSTFEKILMPVPPLALQREFAARVEEARALKTQQACSRQRLEDLFQALLHRAFVGEL